MGGFETEVTGATKTVMLEAATFNGPTIRRTSKALGLRSEASQRFERGVDTILNHNALNRAIYLLEEIGAGKAVPGVAECYPVPENRWKSKRLRRNWPPALAATSTRQR